MAEKLGLGCSHVGDVQWADGYADGSDAPKGIAYANWNDDDRYVRAGETIEDDGAQLRISQGERVKAPGKIMSRLCAVLERMGVQIEWSDGVTTCDGCNLLVQTQPDSYGWQPAYVETDDGLTCSKCLEGDEETYLEGLEGTTKGCIESINPSDHSYVRIAENLQRGWHSGQDADPRVIAKALRAKGVERFIFQIDDVSQFDATFSVYVHTDEADKVTELTTVETGNKVVHATVR